MAGLDPAIYARSVAHELAKGVERIVEIQLNGAEHAMFEKSAEAVQTLVEACKKIAPDLGK